MTSRGVLCAVLLCSTALWSGEASARTGANEAAIEALREARKARAEALKALQDADRAIAQAEALVGVDSSDGLQAEPLDEALAGSVGRPPRDYARIASEALPCDPRCGTDEVASALSEFTQRYLGLTRVADYRTKLSPAFRIQGGKSGGYGEIGPSWSRRYFNTDGAHFRPALHRLTITGLAKIDEDDKISLGTWSKADGFSASSDLAVGAEYRHSWGLRQSLPDARAKLTATIAKMYADCAAANAADPCDPDRIAEWMAKEGRGQKYFTEAVAPIWGVGENDPEKRPRLYAGAKGRYGFLKEEFYPLADPGGTGVPLIATLPADLGKTGRADRKFNPAFAKAYFGFALAPFDEDGWDVGLAFSAGWNRAIRYPKDTEDVQLCYDDLTAGSPTTGFARCKTINIAVPYAADGLTFGAGFNFLPPPTWLGRPNLSLLGSYDDAFQQWSVSLPVAFAVDASGALKAGLKATWSSEGETPYGQEIPAKGVLGVFLEHSVDFPTIP